MGLTQKLGTIPLAIQTDSSNNVGIGGTPSGTYGKLSVFGGVSIKDDNNAKLEIGRYSSGASNSYIKLGANSNSLRISNATDSADLITFTNSGNVGIGTTTPALTTSNRTTLDIGNATESILVLSTGGSWRSYFYNDGTNLSIANSGGFINFDVLGERMRITNTGRVGINTSTPQRTFDARGAVNLSTTAPSVASTSGAYADLHLRTWSGATSSPARISVVDNWMEYVSTFTDGHRWFNYSSNGVLAERARITSGGLFKTTTNGVFFNNGVYNEINNFNNVSGDVNMVFGLGSNTQTTASYFLICATYAIGDRMYIYGNGNIVNTFGSYGTLSDVNLKENIVDATPKLDDLLKLKVRNFNLINDESKTKQIGFIAQEFEEVFAGMVDIDGKSGMKTIKTSVLVPMLVKAIQELNAKVTALENK